MLVPSLLVCLVSTFVTAFQGLWGHFSALNLIEMMPTSFSLFVGHPGFDAVPLLSCHSPVPGSCCGNDFGPELQFLPDNCTAFVLGF